MLYPVYVHKDEDSAYGVTIPDFPGCFAAADSFQEVAANVQEAVELYAEDEGMVLPAPTDLDELQADKDYVDGTWIAVDIDTSKLSSKTKRINTTMPELLIMAVDRYAEDHKMSRSGFLTMVAGEYLREHCPKRAVITKHSGGCLRQSTKDSELGAMVAQRQNGETRQRRRYAKAAKPRGKT
ncbi:MAG: type II toxin-antitoxin system HicB family antitoxin [Candidatus Sedimenticola sp. 6PFRAG7]